MNPLFAPADHPVDGIRRCADIVTFCAEALERPAGCGLEFTPQARDGLSLVLLLVGCALDDVETRLTAAGQ